MKQYTFPIECHSGHQTRHPISDGYSFVFKTTNQFKFGQREIFFQIMFGNDYYRVNVDQLRSKINILSPKHCRVVERPILPSVENIVIRIIKGMESQTIIRGIYFNGLFIDTPWTFPSTRVNNVCAWGNYTMWSSSYPEVTLTVFDEAESRNAAEFAQAILLNPDASPFEIKAEERRKVLAGYEWIAEEKGREFERREKALADRERELEARERAVEQREKEINQEEDLDKELERREMELHSDGADRPLHALPDVHPPDADLIKLSATIAWPRAVNYVLGRPSLTTLQMRHDSLMSEWVVARGDNISSDAYDYFVYSHGVVWTNVILEHTAESEAKLAKIRERHKALMELLV